MGRKRNPIIQKEIKIFNVWTNENNNYKQINGNWWNAKQQKWEKITLIIFKATQRDLYDAIKSIPMQKLIIVKARIFSQDVEAKLAVPRYILNSFEIKPTKYQQHIEYKKSIANKERESVLEDKETNSAIESPMVDVFAEVKGETNNGSKN